MKLFELAATLSLDTSDFDKEVNETTKKASSFGSTLSGIGSIAAKGVAVATTATAAAIGTVLTDSIKNFAEYEQLVGGIETLFKESSDSVLQLSQTAFSRAGMSANAYLDTVMSFSASLLQSLEGDTKAAMEYADMAITDMSDNANKMGTDMTLIQNAYQGFAKQNYTMLDNLKLGFGGTKEEMQRLLETASELTGKEYNLDNLNEVFEAIHVIQEELGITGTTAAEATETISGSIATWQAAFENLSTSLATGNEELQKQYLADLTTATENVLKNLLPAVKAGLDGIWNVTKEGVKYIWDEGLPTVMEEGANAVIEGVNELFGTNIPKITSIQFPTWDEVKAAASAAWQSIRQGMQNLIDGTTIAAKIIVNPTLVRGTTTAAKSVGSAVAGATGSDLVGALSENYVNSSVINPDAPWLSGLMNLFNPNATGLDYVPYNEYLARLHEGEAVLTKTEANAWRRGEGQGVTIDLNGLAEALGEVINDRPIAINIDGKTFATMMAKEMSRSIGNRNIQTLMGMGG